MQIPAEKIKALKRIISSEFGVHISDEHAQQLGASLLRLTRVGVTALARAEDKKSSLQAREESSLEPKTST